MKVLVNGEERILTAIGANGIEWTEELMGEEEQLKYDSELDVYTLPEDCFDWWEEVIENYNKVSALEETLDDEAFENYNNEMWSSDLDVAVQQRLDWLEQNV